MPFKFKFSALFVLTLLSFAVLATPFAKPLATPAQAKNYIADTLLYKSANTPISSQFFNSGEEDSGASSPPPPSSGEQEGNGLQNMIKGSLLGKLLFNMPFEKASLVDIIALLALAFMISKLISRANSKGTMNNPNNNDPNSPHSSGPAAPPPGFDPWGRLRSKQASPKKGKTIPFPGTEEHATGNAQPAEFYVEDQPEFDQEDDEFLKGAKMLYVRLHEAWKNQNLEFIQHFSSPQVFKLFQTRSQGPEKNDFIDIVKVEAKVLKEEVRNGERYVVVEFTALAHKSKQAGPPNEMKENWAFLEPAHTGTWRLEEIL